jgi:hypothetical protein
MAEAREQPPDDAEYRYWAFISYSQRDGKFAQRLHEWLEQYWIPWSLVGQRSGNFTIPRRLFPIFRDRDELPSASDLPTTLNIALKQSRALIVVCSPRAAASPWVNKEVLAFKTSGRGNRIFPIILDGEPGGDASASGCFPPALRFVVDDDGRTTTTKAEPAAADVRDGRDGWPNACLKLVAGILGVGFDALRQREVARARRRRLVGLVTAIAAGVALAAAYIVLADTGLNLPGGNRLRAAIDHEGWTIFRPVPSEQRVVGKLDQLRGKLRSAIYRSIEANKVRTGTAPRSPVSPWEVAQVAAALYSDRDARMQDAVPLQAILAQVFSHDLVVRSGEPLGWPEDQPLSRAEAPLPFLRAEAPLYLVIALSRSLARHDPALAAIEPTYKRYPETTQKVLDRHYLPDVGAWKTAAQEDSEPWFTYTSALALEALLEMRANGVCWRGSCEQRDGMIRNTSSWLVKSFVDRSEEPGWEPGSKSDLASGTDPDLSAFIYGVLARASVEAGIELPPGIETGGWRQLAKMVNRSYKPAYGTLTHWAAYTNSEGVEVGSTLTVRTFWYPWSIRGTYYWIRYLDRLGLPLEYKIALERTRGHLVLDLSDEMLDDVARSLPFAAAEIDYALNGAR